MTPRQPSPVYVHRAARADLTELRDRNPWAQKAAREALRVLGLYPEKGTPKRAPLDGFMSWPFKANPSNNFPSGRIIYAWDGDMIEIIAVSDDHDDAYTKARARVKPKR